MVGVRTVSALVGLASFGLVSAASADPVTFAQVTSTSSANGFTFTNTGSSGILNTTNASGDVVSFNYENIAGLSSNLTGNLTAIEQINGGAGVTTTAIGSQVSTPNGPTDYQPFNSAMTITYKLANPIGGLSNLLTISIVPNLPGTTGAVLSGQDGSTGASLLVSYPPSTSYTETFTSDFLNFAINDPITASYSLSALNPMMMIGSDGFLSSFMADFTGTFSSALAPLTTVPEPASFALLAVGLVGLGFAARRRSGFSVA